MHDFPFANDTHIFANPVKAEVYFFHQSLHSLVSPLDSSWTWPRRSSYLSDALTLTCQNVHFPCKDCHLPREIPWLLPAFLLALEDQFQLLIENIASHLSGWKGKNLPRLEMVTLAKLVLPATTTYHSPSGLATRLIKSRTISYWKVLTPSMQPEGNPLSAIKPFALARTSVALVWPTLIGLGGALHMRCHCLNDGAGLALGWI